MDAAVNSIKAAMLSDDLQVLPKMPSGKPGKASRAASDLVTLLADARVAADLVSDPEIAQLWANANSRVYAAFQGVDRALAIGCSGTSPHGGWGNAYKKWMTDFIPRKNLENWSQWVQPMIRSLQSNLDELDDDSRSALQTLSRADASKFTFNVPLHWSGPAINMRRDLTERDDSCLLSSSSVAPSHTTGSGAQSSHGAESTKVAYPPPTCSGESTMGIDQGKADDAIIDFCKQTGEIKPGAKPISKTYRDDIGNTDIRISLLWDDKDKDCPSSLSPSNNKGKDCTILLNSTMAGGCGKSLTIPCDAS